MEIAGGNHLTVIFHDFIDGEWLTLPDDPTGAAVVETILEAIDLAGSDEAATSAQDMYVGVWETSNGYFAIHGDDGTW